MVVLNRFPGWKDESLDVSGFMLSLSDELEPSLCKLLSSDETLQTRVKFRVKIHKYYQ